MEQPVTAKEHWEKVYSTKKSDEVSWFQDYPQTSMELIRSFSLPKDAAIIDIGGGDSRLADFLLDEGFTNISVLDISAGAITRAKERLGSKAGKVNWIVTDITEFVTETKFDLWHDRAAFHFLTTEEQVNTYLNTARKNISPGGYLTIGTFSETGPEKCSGIKIQQYSAQSLESKFSNGFKKISCREEVHATPFGSSQNFIFCSFRRVEG